MRLTMNFLKKVVEFTHWIGSLEECEVVKGERGCRAIHL